MATVRARYEKGVLTPLEPLDLEEGKEVVVSVEDTSQSPKGLASIVEMVEEMRASYPADMWDGLPTDLAKNKKHYLYGHPKEED